MPAREESVEFGLENEKVIHAKSINIEFSYVPFYYTIVSPVGITLAFLKS